MPSVEVKLLDLSGTGYTVVNRPPQGEIWVRASYSVTNGYYMQEFLNDNETIFIGDGWMRMGDIGQLNEDSMLSLI
jgi:long-chain acyl-CoA synthetase